MKTTGNSDQSTEDIIQEKYHTLKKCALFSNLSEAVQQQCLINTKLKHYDDGEIIYDVGDVPDYVFVVSQGVVRIELLLPDGGAFFIAPALETHLFGEFEALTNAGSIARASAMGPVSILLIPKSNFIHQFNTVPLFSQLIAKQLVMTIRLATMAAAHLFNSSIESKLASFLVVFAKRKGGAQGDSVKLKTKLSQDQIAEMLSTSRQTANKYLGAWKERGWINYHQGEIEILDYEALAALASSDLMVQLEALESKVIFNPR